MQGQALAAVVLTFNEARHIRDCLDSLGFADLRLVLDSGSDDDTAALARAAGARVEQRRFVDYAEQRNHALALLRGAARHVLFVDADERASPQLAAEIRDALSERPEVAGWRIPRHNYIFGRLTLRAGWYPDYQTRLLRPERARYDAERPVHEVVVLDGERGTLRQPLLHYNYDTLRQFQRKQRDYSERAARMRVARGERPRLRAVVTEPLHHFRWRYVTLRGYREGRHGLGLCALMAWYELRTALRMRRLARGRAQGVSGRSRP